MQLYFKNKEEWRNWLAENHEIEKEIWMVFYKKNSGVECVSYDDAVCEALCYGWIDSLARSVDDDKYIQKFSPRRKNSNWSDSNKQRVLNLISEGKMTEAGMKYFTFDLKQVEEELKNPSKRQYTILPDKYLQIIAGDNAAFDYYTKLSPSHKHEYASYVMDAKKEETRLRRLNRVIDTLRANKHRIF